SETAHQMKAIIRERLAAGESPEQVKAYFVEKYGTWILLSPPRQGFNLLVWIVPFAGLAGGLALVLILVRRWSRRPATGTDATPLSADMRARIQRETSAREAGAGCRPSRSSRSPCRPWRSRSGRCSVGRPETACRRFRIARITTAGSGSGGRKPRCNAPCA